MPLIQDIRSLCRGREELHHTSCKLRHFFSKKTELISKQFITRSANLTQRHSPLFSPKVREEALQVVGVAKLVFALVSTTHQAAPGGVQLSALFLDIIHSLRVGLDQTLCRLSERVHLCRGVDK